MLTAFFSALFCAFTRGLLCAFDRGVMRKQEVNFHVAVLYNNLFPMLVAWLVAILAVGHMGLIESYLFRPGVILSALGAQLAAHFFFLAFRHMSVKNVALSGKLADIILPFIALLITAELPIKELLFSELSVIAFAPIAYAAYRESGSVKLPIVLTLILVLCFQCGVNHYFEVRQFATSWPKFLSMMACILMWRSVFAIAVVLIPLRQVYQNPAILREAPIVPLLLRAILAFVSQAAFFFSITRVGSIIAWPVLNSTPILSCYLAHLFLQERVQKPERWAFVGLASLSISYLIITL